MIIDLNGEMTDENGFFVVGGSDLTSANLKCPNDKIKFKHQLTTGTWKNMMTNGDRFPVGIALVYVNEVVPMLVLNDLTPYIVIRDNIWIDKLAKITVDLVVYARKAQSNRCLIYEKIRSEFRKSNYIFRDFNESM